MTERRASASRCRSAATRRNFAEAGEEGTCFLRSLVTSTESAQGSTVSVRDSTPSASGYRIGNGVDPNCVELRCTLALTGSSAANGIAAASGALRTSSARAPARRGRDANRKKHSRVLTRWCAAYACAAVDSLEPPRDRSTQVAQPTIRKRNADPAGSGTRRGCAEWRCVALSMRCRRSLRARGGPGLARASYGARSLRRAGFGEIAPRRGSSATRVGPADTMERSQRLAMRKEVSEMIQLLSRIHPTAAAPGRPASGLASPCSRKYGAGRAPSPLDRAR
jgi:hypothetical protein